jgi:uncharacterized protein YodC (DUF2158 family)
MPFTALVIDALGLTSHKKQRWESKFRIWLDTKGKTMREREPVSKGKEFGVDDLVRLKSGGPSMTIEEMDYARIDSVSGMYYAKCIWYTSDGNTPRATFEESLLEVAFISS